MVKKAIFLKLRKKLDSFCKINIVFYTFFFFSFDLGSFNVFIVQSDYCS